MKAKLRNIVGFLALCLTLTEGSSQSHHNNQYSSYPAYSTLSQESGASAGSQNSGSVSDASKVKAIDLTTNGVGDGPSEANQRAHQAVGYNPQPQGSHSMYYYEMYPAPGVKPKPRCAYYTANGKCQYRRDSSVGGQDSYTAAAHSAPSASYGAPMEMYGHHDSYGVMDEEEEKGGEGGGLGGLAGLIGLLGLKGLKGLKALAPFGFALLPLIPLLPLLPLILLALVLFIPVPVIVSGNRDLKGVGLGEINKSVNLISIARMAAEVIESEDCIERISCEVGRVSRKYNTTSKWLDRLTDNLPKSNIYAKRVVKGLEKEDKESGSARRSNLDGACSRFVCKPRAIFAKVFAK